MFWLKINRENRPKIFIYFVLMQKWIYLEEVEREVSQQERYCKL